MAAPTELSRSSDASFLRRLLEPQAACLLRVRLDGALLACNQAALRLFGAGEQRAVLDGNLIDRLVPAERTQWHEFVARCSANGAASFECHLVIRDNNARPVLLQGVPLTDHPDGVESLLLHLLDQSQAPQPDHSIESAPIVELEKKLEQSRLQLLRKEREFGRDVAMLKSALAAAHAARASAVADRQAAVDAQQQSVARTREDAALDIEQSRQALAASRLELAQALAEQTRIAARVEEQTREQDLMRAEHHTALRDLEVSKQAALAELLAQLAQTSAEQARLVARLEAAERDLDLQRAERERAHDGLIAGHQRALADVQTAKRDELEVLERRLQAATAEHRRLQALVEEDAVDRERIAADHRAAVDTLQQALARAREDAALQVEQSHQALAQSRSALEQSLAEQSFMAEGVEEQTREQDLIRAEHQRTLADVETSKREALAELRSQLSQTLADQRRLAALLEEHESERDRLHAEHHRVLTDMESAKREALAELRSQLSQALVDQRHLASHADQHALELNRLRAEHQAALTDRETRHRDALAESHRELAQSAERAEQHEHERGRISAEHALAIADLQAGHEAAVAEWRSTLSDAVAEHHRLTALLEEHERERERLAAEHRRAIADLQASKQEAVAGCERILTEVHQALLVRDPSRHVGIERRLIDGIDDGPQMKVDGERLAALQGGLTRAFSQMQAVFNDEPALKPPLEAKQKGAEAAEDADLLHEPFDDADDAFVHQMLEGIHADRVPETHTRRKTRRPAQAVSAPLALETDDLPADDMFDAKDATFARRLMDTPGPRPRPSAEDDSVADDDVPE